MENNTIKYVLYYYYYTNSAKNREMLELMIYEK